MTIDEIKRRKQYLVDGLSTVTKTINTRYAKMGKDARISNSLVSKVLKGEREDRHGIVATYRAITDKEMKSRQQFALKLAKGK